MRNREETWKFELIERTIERNCPLTSTKMSEEKKKEIFPSV